jgi:C1A family cysteine protease
VLPNRTVTFQPLSNSAVSSAVSPATTVSWEPRLSPLERLDGESGSCWVFLTQFSLIIELKPSSFPSDRSKKAYLITLMSGKALAWATAV